MHLLRAQIGAIDDGTAAVDLDQTPGEITVLTSADTEIGGLATAKAVAGDSVPSLRLASLLQLTNNYSIDLYVEKTLSKAKLIVIRVLGGPGYWPYGLDEVKRLARGYGIKLAVVSGAAYPDQTLQDYCTLPPDVCDRLWAYLVEGGPVNFRSFLEYGGAIVANEFAQPPPVTPLPKAGLYWPGIPPARQSGRGIAAITFYRALLQAGDLAPVDQLIADLDRAGLDALPVYLTSPKDPDAAKIAEGLLAEAAADCVINLTAFGVSEPGATFSGTVFDRLGILVFQAVLSGGTEEAWQKSARGLGPRDVAMHVALPEIDGRIITGAISFKAESRLDAVTETRLAVHQPKPDRTRHVAELAANWVRLRRTLVGNRKVAIVLANYPGNDAEIGNGVGLDTPAGTLKLLEAMRTAGYSVGKIPASGDELLALLQRGPTNKQVLGRAVTEHLQLADYERLLAGLPPAAQSEIRERWGDPAADHYFHDCAFALPARRFGNVIVAVQPGRGRGLDAKASHHDQTIPPPHGHAAFYLWLRHGLKADAVIHMGKHGNLEWLPGKAMALSEACFPEALLGPLPHIYPFIVNDPGEGTQAKRRTAAVIVDHLTPPLSRAESYGATRDLEVLVDEYFEAAGVDPRRLKHLGKQILDLARSSGLDKDCGINLSERDDAALSKLDNFLCDLKEKQIRDGLHVFGVSPTGAAETDLLVALTRTPRGAGQSLLRALAADLGLNIFDPLDCKFANPWEGPKPPMLVEISSDPWRTNGDTVERLELLARSLVDLLPPPQGGRESLLQGLPFTTAVLDEITHSIRPNVRACGDAEIAGVLTALDGRFVPPGPAGAPTRGRLDTLPTGRNFYSIDTRTVPTEAAYRLGSLSAERLVKAYFQEHGRFPVQMAISAWGTSNMRTGGDDIAQALALAGVKPLWEASSRRVSGFEIIPLSKLRRPRVDVLFRISGFFRDAFPTQIDLIDSAFRAVAALEEADDMNPLKAEAAGGQVTRIFGSKPGGYGAGIKDLIETARWTDRAALAKAYISASHYAYGSGREGEANLERFTALAGRSDAVVQNQDTVEFDLLDSTDFFEFEGGLAAAVAEVSGQAPAIYHTDHSLPERPVVRRLEEEIARVVRARAVNPKWLAAARRHGYKGASEMVATVKNLLGFAATTGAVQNHHFELLYDAYLVDPEQLAFLEKSNPAAIDEMAKRFLEAIDRELWTPRRNSAYAHLKSLKKAPADVEERQPVA